MRGCGEPAAQVAVQERDAPVARGQIVAGQPDLSPAGLGPAQCGCRAAGRRSNRRRGQRPSSQRQVAGCTRSARRPHVQRITSKASALGGRQAARRARAVSSCAAAAPPAAPPRAAMGDFMPAMCTGSGVGASAAPGRRTGPSSVSHAMVPDLLRRQPGQQRACPPPKRGQSAARCAACARVRLAGRSAALKAAASPAPRWALLHGSGNAPWRTHSASSASGWLSERDGAADATSASSRRKTRQCGSARWVRHRAGSTQRAAVPTAQAASNSRMICIAHLGRAGD